MKKNSLIVLLFLTVILPNTRQALHAQQPFTGTWTADFSDSRAVTSYILTFKGATGCTLRLANIANGTETKAETEGTYSLSGDIFRLSAVFRNQGMNKSIQWVSAITFGSDGNSFSILGTDSGGRQARLVFIKQNDTYTVAALAQSVDTLCRNIPERSKIAIVSIAASDKNEGAYYLDDITLLFVNSRKYVMVDRRDIDVILAEQNFQMSGYVDDNSAVSIGHFLGAAIVITGSISETGGGKRLMLKALDVKTAEILAMAAAGL